MDTSNPGLRGKITISKRLVSTPVVCDINYPFREDGPKILALKSMG